MLSKQTIQTLLRFFSLLAQGEKQVETLREILCSQPEFEPYVLFRRIDERKTGTIEAIELQSFLNSNNVQIPLQQIIPVANHYSSKQDGKLRYCDFLQLVLTTQNEQLRGIVTQRPTRQYVHGKDSLPYEIEYGIVRILEKEISLFKRLHKVKFDLHNSRDFDLITAFNTIDEFNSGIITQEMLKQFFKENEKNYDILSIYRRLDQNRDNQVDIEDFKLCLEPVEPFDFELIQESSQFKDSSSQFQQSINQVINTSKTIKKSSGSPIKGFPNRRSLQSIQNHVSKMRTIAIQKISQSKSLKNKVTQKIPAQSQNEVEQEFLYLVESLRIIIQLEQECEIKKENLALSTDFNVIDLFHSFDLDGSSKLCGSDIQSTLAQIEIYPSKPQLYLWVKRYDNDRDGKWNIREFLSAFTPLNKPIAEKLRMKAQKPQDQMNDQILQFSKETLSLLKETIKTQIENEVAIECLRQKLNKRPNFDLNRMFQGISYLINIYFILDIDNDDDGFLTESDIRCFLENNGVVTSEAQLNLLINRFDHNQDGLISYADFLNEIFPRSKQQF